MGDGHASERYAIAIWMYYCDQMASWHMVLRSACLLVLADLCLMPTAPTKPPEPGVASGVFEPVDPATISDAQIVYPALLTIESFDRNGLAKDLLTQTIGIAADEVATVIREAKTALAKIKSDTRQIMIVRCQATTKRPADSDEVATFFESIERDIQTVENLAVLQFAAAVGADSHAKILAWARMKIGPSMGGARLNYRKYLALPQVDAAAIFDRACKLNPSG
jgi:hypothetical protein